MATEVVATKTKKPSNSAFKQQRLKAWQPILTPKTVLPTLFIIGLLFIPIGIGIYVESNNVKEIILDYTHCREPSIPRPGGIDSWSYNNATSTCTLSFRAPSTLTGPVYMYYRLSNFYQNHRRYVKSLDTKQLLGEMRSRADVSSCTPLEGPKTASPGQSWVMVGNLNVTDVSQAVFYPCGLVANSMFSDDLGPPIHATTGPINFNDNDLSWDSDAKRFQDFDFASIPNAEQILIPPPEWQVAFPQWANGYTAANFPKLGSWSRFHVWMRTAGLPTFRKLWAKSADAMRAGDYTMTIRDTFDVRSFGGTKSVVFSTTSVLGGKNGFLGIAYILVGSICWLLGLLFLVKHMIKPRKLGDHTYLSWNQPHAQNKQD